MAEERPRRSAQLGKTTAAAAAEETQSARANEALHPRHEQHLDLQRFENSGGGQSLDLRLFKSHFLLSIPCSCSFSSSWLLWSWTRRRVCVRERQVDRRPVSPRTNVEAPTDQPTERPPAESLSMEVENSRSHQGTIERVWEREKSEWESTEGTAEERKLHSSPVLDIHLPRKIISQETTTRHGHGPRSAFKVGIQIRALDARQPPARSVTATTTTMRFAHQLVTW